MLQKINPRACYCVAPYRDRTAETGASSGPPTTEVLIWADLRISSVARGTRAFIEAWAACAKRQPTLKPRTLLVGRVPREAATRLLGCDLPEEMKYGPRLEDEHGVLRRGAITVIPDAGGTGIKTRLLHVLASKGCAACLYSQTEGIECIADSGAINAHTLPELARSVWTALETESFRATALRGGELFERHYSIARIEQSWEEMVDRALHLRSAQFYRMKKIG